MGSRVCFGTPRRIRTFNSRLRRPLLYPLSYGGRRALGPKFYKPFRGNRFGTPPFLRIPKVTATTMAHVRTIDRGIQRGEKTQSQDQAATGPISASLRVRKMRKTPPKRPVPKLVLVLFSLIFRLLSFLVRCIQGGEFFEGPVQALEHTPSKKPFGDFLECESRSPSLLGTCC